MERVEEHLGVEKEVASFVLPIGATVNMDGTSLYQAVAAVFIAQAFNMQLDLYASADNRRNGNTGLDWIGRCPRRWNGDVGHRLGAIGVPEYGLALIFAVDRILDMCRTTVNVTGDATVSMLIAKSFGQLGQPQVKSWDDFYKKETTEEPSQST